MSVNGTGRRKPLRLWPGVAVVTLQWLFRFAVPAVFPAALPFALYSGILGGLAVLVWWAFFSRAPLVERLAGVLLFVVGLVATPRILHESLATAMMGLVFGVFVIPVLSLTFVIWAVATRRLSNVSRRVWMVAAIVLACAPWALVRTHGIAGGFDWEFAWRWSETPEERLLRLEGDELLAPLPPVTLETTAAQWPGFRGPARDGIVRGLRIATDWSTAPPVELWRRAVGPGWSSMAVDGDLLYTQEQRGQDEAVFCYRVSTGEAVWRHQDPARFWEAMAGAGPRATPAVRDGRVFAFGATGLLNALDSGSGAVLWSRDVLSDTGGAVPPFGFASSPLVTGDAVIAAAAGRLAAYDAATGEPRWFGEVPGDDDSPYFESYSSPQLLTLGGTPQIVLLNGLSVIGVDPGDGSQLWGHSWPGLHTLQPALTADGDLLVSSSGSSRGLGIRRLGVARGPYGWTVEERWTSNGLKPYFNDFVVHEGHAFGFDGGILACIDLADGERKWKGGRYGLGQLVLLADQDLLLVQSEKGLLALVGATPDGFNEIARFQALEDKVWNHPVLVGDLLLVRNDREMAAFRLDLPAGTGRGL